MSIHLPHVGKQSGGHDPGSVRPKCTHCGKLGHLEDVCFSKHGRPDWHKEKFPDRGKSSSKPANSDITAAVYAAILKIQAAPDTKVKDSDEHFAFAGIEEVISAAAFSASKSSSGSNGTLLDGGSTRHVTFDPADCDDIVPCDIKVKVGGGTVACLQKGTRVYRFYQKGLRKTVRLLDTLIIPGFGIKIAAEAPFLLKGCPIVKHNGVASIST